MPFEDEETDVTDKNSEWVLGVDGCKAGWVGVRVAARGPLRPSVEIYSHFRNVIETDATVIAVDIPIGLLEESKKIGRCVESVARKLLGRRHVCVFSTPSRAVVEYAVGKKFESGYGMTQQAWSICPKIREVDGVIQPDDQSRVFECHPEICFREMQGKPMALGKDDPEGFNARRDVLHAEGFPEGFLNRRRWSSETAGQDDLLDACAAAWTARRIKAGKACCLPDNPPIDERGLAMAMWV